MNVLFLEFLFFTRPLRMATMSGENLSDFLSQFGYQLDDDEFDTAIQQVSGLSNTLDELEDLIAQVFSVAGDIDNLKDLKNIPPEDIALIVEKGTEIYGGVDSIISLTLSLAAFPVPTAEFFQEILDYLIDSYLNLRLPAVREFAKALDVRQQDFREVGSADGRMIDYTCIRYKWSRLGQFISETDVWADEVYGWGRDFEHVKALMAISDIVNAVGGRTSYHDVDSAVLNRFVTNLPPPIVIAGNSVQANPIIKVKLPVFEKRSPLDALGNSNAEGEAGFMALPYGDLDQPQNLGLAVSPYAEGSVTGEHNINDILSFTFNLAGNTVGGRYITLQPSGIGVEGGTTTSASFEASFKFKKGDGSKVILLGKADATRLDIQSANITAGGDLSGDFYIAAGVEDLALTIDVGDDGLLKAVLADPITISAGDLALGWRLGRGVYFEGGSNIGITIPVDLKLGPVNIHEFSLEFDFNEPFSLEVTTTADITIGPLFAYAEGMGIRASLVPATGGLFGNRDLNFGFVAPTGYAISLDADPIIGGGMLSVEEDEYRGALALSFSTFGFSAFGILNTQLPDGDDGFSFAASIFGEFNVPLSFGFFLTGVGGIIGVNRTIDTEALRDVLYSGRLDNLLFPTDPIENAKSILDDMAAIMPPHRGQHLFGPVVKIGWGQPILLDITLGVIIEVGSNVRILILGGLSAVLPTKEAALVDLNISFFGEIDFGNKTISFDATLTNSRILAFTLSGDAAVRSGWGDRIEHIVSFGGLHPQFPKPADLPDLRRITINFGTNNPKVTISAYTAITSNSLQFGGRADLYAKGPKIWLLGQFAAEGWIYLDALIYFDPFSFDVALGGGLNLLRNGSVIAGLGFDLRLRGPNTFRINGKAWITILRKDIKIPINHSWGSSQSISIDTVNAAGVLRQALLKSRGFEPIVPQGRVSGIVFVSGDGTEGVLDPLGSVKFVQRAVPLDVTIQKIGEAQISVSANKVDIRVKTKSGQILTTNRADSDFVRGHFFNLTEAERLRSTAFEVHKSGFEVGETGMAGPTQKAITSTYSYEFIEIPIETEEKTKILTTLLARGDLARTVKRFSNSKYDLRLRGEELLGNIEKMPDRLHIKAEAYIPNVRAAKAADVIKAHTTTNGHLTNIHLRDTIIKDGFAETSLSKAQAHVGVEGQGANRAVKDYIVAAGEF